MASKFLLQILDKTTGEVVQIEPGLQLEADLVKEIVTRLTPDRARGTTFAPFISDVAAALRRRGVGVFRTEDHVEQDLRDALHEVLLNGTEVTEHLTVDVTKAVKDAFLSLKKRVRP